VRSAELLNKEELQRCQKQLEYQLLGLSLCFDSSILLFFLSQDRLNFKEKMAGKGNGGAGGDGGSIIWSIIWFLILFFVGFWLAGFCAGFHILFQPFSVCIEGCSVINFKNKKTSFPRLCTFPR
jgi:hypothetical protein